MWKVRKFNQLTLDELFKIYQLRCEVFVAEQKITLQDIDDNDKKAWHLFLIDDNQIICYGRIYEQTHYVTFGRIAVKSNYRGKHLGEDLVRHIMNLIADKYPKKEIMIEAQKYVEDLYTSFNFVPTGGVFLEGGVEHIKMKHQPFIK
ncbi:GNAT family N-acetyltransferase [Fructilactobacillus fructivorans]|uniref:GNAT family N-acetyltransferase n=1 Tax=Fructilactobacillus fructivorans TaxID=1614 RepID=A0AAE6P0M7_9LACO|nr:GNAT family N-acetyltransferase [Fructilactobacillus fructivorans]KRK58724.1 putative acetyltransferase (putative) [Fructilactobacillus fructivorans]KRN13635.1 putative acetyltransferase (putative) [Fructilactobacillus fructivorans]KRN39664.1 putative acetyltransferase (putative) [Fructilactobacillus fructivorans]KRN43385.1 putative acetyltransferase (putative) [Fructilactobacillus fructivorans]QFX92725.1 GNAT family N-acetyltransferase [Fructilactobacillus fructivorans]